MTVFAAYWKLFDDHGGEVFPTMVKFFPLRWSFFSHFGKILIMLKQLRTSEWMWFLAELLAEHNRMITFEGMVVVLCMVKSNKNIKLASNLFCHQSCDRYLTDTTFFREFRPHFRPKNFIKLLFVGKNKQFWTVSWLKNLMKFFQRKIRGPKLDEVFPMAMKFFQRRWSFSCWSFSNPPVI